MAGACDSLRPLDTWGSEGGLGWGQYPNLLAAFLAVDEVLREPDGVRSGDWGRTLQDLSLKGPVQGEK